LNITGIIAAIKEGKVVDLEAHYKEGWRLHHHHAENAFYLTEFLNANKPELFSKDHLITVDENSLKHANNSDLVFGNPQIMASIKKHYENSYGFTIVDEGLATKFVEYEAKFPTEFKGVRDFVGIEKKALPATPTAPTNPPTDGAPTTT